MGVYLGDEAIVITILVLVGISLTSVLLLGWPLVLFRRFTPVTRFTVVV